MLSVRLKPNQSKILDFLSATSGLSKSQIIASALEGYFREQNLAHIPLEEKIYEANQLIHLNRMKNSELEWAKARKVADMVKDSNIWSPIHNEGAAPDTGRIYGRNIVIGFTETQDEKIAVVSKLLTDTPNLGTNSYAYYVTDFETWESVMKPVTIKSVCG